MGAQVLDFPVQRQRKRRTRVQSLDGFKFFTKPEIQHLRRKVKEAAMVAEMKENVTAIREWMAVDLLTTTGMRVSELVNLRIRDCRVGYGESEVYIACGKGRRSRTVPLPSSTKAHLKKFLDWKLHRGEPMGDDALLFIGQRGPWTTQAVQQLVKKRLKALNLYRPGKSVHSLRHSYAVELYRKTRDLRLVQKLLGHASIQTTTIYADVLKDDMQEAVKGIWRG